MMPLPKLHDATLVSLSLDGECAALTVAFKVGVPTGGVVHIMAVGVTNLECPRQMPWGPSNSVNTANVEARGDAQIIMIEMQSGDVIEVLCREVSFESNPKFLDLKTS